MDYAQEELTLQQSESSTVPRPANVLPLLESVWAMLTSVTDGRNSSPAFAALDHDGSWLKMCLGSCQLCLDGSLETYCEPWPKRGTLLDGNAGVLPMWERRTRESGCSLLGGWPTPDTNNHRDGSKMRRAAKGNHAMSLHHMVYIQEYWPTPRAQSSTGPSKTASRQGGEDLQAAAMWGTPKATDCKGSGPFGSRSQQHDQQRKNLKGMVMESGAGQLNPDWVETLMGYPPGWTELPVNWKPKSGRRSKAKNNMSGSRQE